MATTSFPSKLCRRFGQGTQLTGAVGNSVEADGGGPNSIGYGQYPFFVASSLCIFSACIVWLLPYIGQDTIEKEDMRFRQYLLDNGFDVNSMGTKDWQEKQGAAHVN